MNLDQLTPAPWKAELGDVLAGKFQQEIACCFCGSGQAAMPCHPDEEDVARAEFIALARNAFDVMMRRGWNPVKVDGKWQVSGTDESGRWETTPLCTWFPDPFTALVEADKWYRENVEEQP